MRPFISHTNSLLSNSPKFIDHILQPIAQSYEYCIQDSSDLIRQLQQLTFPEDTILVTIDVESLFPSILQSEVLDLPPYNELHAKWELVQFDPAFVIHFIQFTSTITILHSVDSISNNYIRGTAMGSAFSTNLANIFMPVILRSFLRM